MALNVLKSLQDKLGKNTKLYAAVLAAVFALSQELNAQNTGGGGINIDPADIKAARHVGAESPDRGGLMIEPQDTASFPNPVAGVINQHTDGKYYKYDGSNRVPFEGIQGPAGAGVPTGTTNGQTIRYDGTNWVANTNIFNNGNLVGIGSTSPITKLDVRSIFTDSLDVFQVRKNNTVGFHVDKNLNVGVGVPTGLSLDKLHLRDGRFRMDSTAATGHAKMRYMPLTKTLEFRGAKDNGDTPTPVMMLNMQNKSVTVSTGNTANSKFYVENDNSTFALNGAFQVYNSTNNGLVALFRTDSLDANAKGVQIQSGNTGLGVVASTGDAVVVDAVTGTNAVRADKGNINAVDGNIIERGKNLVRFHGLLTTDPTLDLEAGDMYYYTPTGKLRFYTGTARIDLN